MSEARPLKRSKPANVSPYALTIHWLSARDIPSWVRIVGSAICTIEKSRTMTNCARTSSARIRESRGGEAAFVKEDQGDNARNNALLNVVVLSD